MMLLLPLFYSIYRRQTYSLTETNASFINPVCAFLDTQLHPKGFNQLMTISQPPYMHHLHLMHPHLDPF